MSRKSIVHLSFQLGETSGKKSPTTNSSASECYLSPGNPPSGIVLITLRMGHTQITLSQPRASCLHCSSQNLTVDHFFSCPPLLTIRSFLHVSSSILPTHKKNKNCWSLLPVSSSLSLLLQRLTTLYFPSSPQPLRSMTLLCQLDIIPLFICIHKLLPSTL